MEQDFQEQIQELQKENAEYLAGWQRAKADLSNYKKEETERKEVWNEYAVQSFVQKLFPILDNLDLAEKQVQAKEDEAVQGFLRIAAQIHSFFKEQGIEEIQALGKPFDPALHEAVGSVQGDPLTSSGQGSPGTIAEVIAKGYTYKGNVIRPVKVKIIQ